MLPVSGSSADFNAFVGAETGILKGVNLNHQHVIKKNFHNVKGLDRNQEITAMAWGNDEQTEVMMGLRDQTVKIFDTEVVSFVSSRKITCGGTGPIVSVGRVDGVTITAVKSGEVLLCRRKNKVEINALDGGGEFLSCMRQNPHSRNIVATGGKESDLHLWDINTPTSQPMFKARNVKHDMLNLRIPVWVSDIAFLEELRCVALCTRHKHIRLYDPRQQKRPTVSFEWGDYPNTAIATTLTCGSQVFVGDAAGYMALFDFRGRNAKQPIHAYRGFNGAVRDIAVHRSEPYVFSVSLDRFLRVHHIYSGRLMFKEYMKSRLNCLLVRNKTNMFGKTLPDKNAKKRKRDAVDIEEGVIGDDVVVPIFDALEGDFSPSREDDKFPVQDETLEDDISPSKEDAASPITLDLD